MAIITAIFIFNVVLILTGVFKPSPDELGLIIEIEEQSKLTNIELVN